MQVVRTIGRAFDVCHQLMQQQHAAKASADEAKSTDGDDDDIHDNDVDTEDSQPDNELQQPAQNSAGLQSTVAQGYSTTLLYLFLCRANGLTYMWPHSQQPTSCGRCPMQALTLLEYIILRLSFVCPIFCKRRPH